MLLRLVAKPALAWQILAGTLASADRSPIGPASLHGFGDPMAT
ncbi:MAG TPA: hypothetical protein VLE71_02925 [Actinomycetota bacterium]|nr:hypothetical protein [Actinomycetota bacterium]